MFKFLKKFLTQEKYVLLFLVFIFIGVHTINYVSRLNFSGDQAMFASSSLEIIRGKPIALIGPPISMNLDGRQLFQGPATYYEFLLFLFLGGFNPIAASYIFMLFCALMIVPLYYGTKWLINQRAAYIAIVIYALLPYYVSFSEFLWNPTFQFSKVPLLILLMGLYQKTRKPLVFFGLSVLIGFMLQYHYQFVLVIAAIFAYYLILVRIKIKEIALFICGIAIGFAPILIFEMRNNFYNLQTAWLFVSHYDALAKPGGDARQHYYLTISIILLIALLGLFGNKIKKLDAKHFYVFLLTIFIFTLSWSLIRFVPKPKTSFWAAAENWNYPADYKIYDIIRKENLTDFNVTNLVYDTLAQVPKFLLKRDNVQIDYVDYYHEKYLFVVEDKNVKNYMDDPAYEVSSLRPFKELKRWEINNYYNMYLVERIEK